LQEGFTKLTQQLDASKLELIQLTKDLAESQNQSKNLTQGLKISTEKVDTLSEGLRISQEQFTQLSKELGDMQQHKNQLEKDIRILQQEREQTKAQLVSYQEKLKKETQARAYLNLENDQLRIVLDEKNQELIAKSQALENIEIASEKKNDEITAHIEETNQLKERIQSLEQGAQWGDDLYRNGDFSDDESPKHRIHGASLYDELREFEDNRSPVALGVSSHAVVDPVVATLEMDNKALQTKLDQTMEQNIELKEKGSPSNLTRKQKSLESS